MRKIRLGVIGTGLAWERLHYPAILELGDRYEIVALCNRTRKDAEEFAKRIALAPQDVYDDYHEMLQRDDLDAVDILVPIDQNYIVSEAVAKSGKNFICEKPLAPDFSQAQKYLDLSKRYNVLMMIAENYRYNEEYLKIKEIIQSGKIGNVVYFIKNNITCFPCDMTKDTFAQTEWRQHPDYPGGTFLDAAVHDMAGIRQIFGDVEGIHAFGNPQKADFSPYTSVNVSILFKTGVIGQYAYFPSGMESQRPLVGFRIFGTLGEIYLEDKTCGILNIAYNEGRSEQVPYTPERGFYNELLNFYHAFQGLDDIKVTPEVEFGDTKMILDALKSIKERRVILADEASSIKHTEYTLASEGTNPYIQ